MVFAVLGAVAFRNTSRRDAVRDALAASLAPEGMFGAPVVENRSGLKADASPAIYVEVRFLVEADRDAFYADAVARLQGVNGPIAGSWLATHDCSHDEPQPRPPCVETDRQVF